MLKRKSPKTQRDIALRNNLTLSYIIYKFLEGIMKFYFDFVYMYLKPGNREVFSEKTKDIPENSCL